MEFKEIFKDLNVRMHRKQKKAFREYVANKASEMGYNTSLEKSILAKNVVVGDIDKAEYIFTAHYDTPPRMPKFIIKHMVIWSFVIAGLIGVASNIIPNVLLHFTNNIKLALEAFYGISLGSMAFSFYSIFHMFGFAGNANKSNFNDNTSGCYALLNLMKQYKELPKEKRDKIAFVFFDNEEKFLLGSFTHRSKNKKTYKNKTYINLDCVGLGKQMNLYHFGKKPKIVDEISRQLSQNSNFTPKAKRSGIFSMSDHFPLRKANHVCLLSVDVNNERSLYEQIHTTNDIKIDLANIKNIVYTIDNLPFIKSLKPKKYENLKVVKKENKIENINKTKQHESSISQPVANKIHNEDWELTM